MYLAHFGFTHYPFERALQPDELFASSAAREAQARLNHLVELRGIGLITGEVGCGKTTLCRQLCASLHPGLYRLFYVPLSTGNVLDMYKAIAWQLGLPIERNRASAYRAIHTEVSRLTVETKIHPVLVVFALIAGEHSYGIVGALFAVPVASIIQTIFTYYRKRRIARAAAVPA